MSRGSKRARTLVDTAIAQEQNEMTTPMQTDYNMDPALMPGSTGPSNWVDPVTYRALKRRFSRRTTRKTAPKKAKTTRRRVYRRRYPATSSSLSGMGPIVITGRGGYWADKFKSGASAAYRALQRGIPEGTFNRLGQAAGGAMFGGLGATAGGLLGSGISSVLGFGDYAIKKNDLLMMHEGMPVPTFQDLNQGIVVCHREYLADITVSGTTFQNRSYIINPGDQTTFPWLSAIAANFEQYEMLGCLFQFRSTCSDFGTTTDMSLGTVVLSTEYDATDSSYASKIEMENAQYSMSGKPSQDIIHPIECDPDSVGPHGLKYIRTGPVPSGQDARMYDHGKFQVATQGIPNATGSIGELWVTYKIALYKPQFNVARTVLTDWYSSANADTSNYWGIGAVSVTNSNLGSTVSGNVLTIPPKVPVGTYLFIHLFYLGSSTTLTNAMNTSRTGCTLTYVAQVPSAGAVSTTQGINMIVVKTADTATVTITAGTLPGSISVCRVMVTHLDTDIGASYA